MRWDRRKERRGKAEGESGSGSGSGSGSVRCRECAEHAVHFMLLHCLSFLTCLLSFFLSLSIKPPFPSDQYFNFPSFFPFTITCAPPCALFFLSLPVRALCWPPSHIHMRPFGRPYIIYTSIWNHYLAPLCFFYIYSTFSSPLVKVVLLILWLSFLHDPNFISFFFSSIELNTHLLISFL